MAIVIADRGISLKGTSWSTGAYFDNYGRAFSAYRHATPGETVYGFAIFYLQFYLGFGGLYASKAA